MEFLFDQEAESLLVIEAEQCRLAKVPEGQAAFCFSTRTDQDLADMFFSLQYQVKH